MFAVSGYEYKTSLPALPYGQVTQAKIILSNTSESIGFYDGPPLTGC